MDTATSGGAAPNRLTDLHPSEVSEAYGSLGFDRLADIDLVSSCAAVIDRPKQAPPDSFVLHAPLELMARAALLGRVAPPGRHPARRRLLWTAATYAAAGPPVVAAPAPSYVTAGAAGEALLEAVSAGDLDAAGAAAGWLAGHVTPTDLVLTLVDAVAPSLAAAAHGGIFLHQVLAFAGTPRLPGTASVARELARQPSWRLQWFEGRSPAPVSNEGHRPVDALVDALRRPPSPGPLDSDFIYPTMHLTEASGLAADVLAPALAGVDRQQAGRALLRVAALSMLQDAPGAAPYGWSHCLTMPHGLLSVAAFSSRPDDLLAVAATYVLGFRTTQGTVDLDPQWAPAAPPVDTLAALDGPPELAAAGAWHAVATDRAEIAAVLAGRAAAHEDAHLAKYTLACLQLTETDPDFAHGYLAAAAYLGAWWRQADGIA